MHQTAASLRAHRYHHHHLSRYFVLTSQCCIRSRCSLDEYHCHVAVVPPAAVNHHHHHHHRGYLMSSSWPFMHQQMLLSKMQCTVQYQNHLLRQLSTTSYREGGILFTRNNFDPKNITYTPDYYDDDDDDDDDDEKNEELGRSSSSSLHSKIHFLLKKIPIGRMIDDDVADARAFLSIVSKWNNEKGAILAEAILERLYKEKDHQLQKQKHYNARNMSNSMNIVLDSEMYNICMDAWNKSKDVGGERIVQRVESLMERMEDRCLNGGNGDTNTTLDGTLSQQHQQQQQQTHTVHTSNPCPDRVSYNCLINAYSKWEERDSSEKVEAILLKMNALANKDDHHSTNSAMEQLNYGEYNIRPDSITYNSAMNYYASRKNHIGAAQRAEDLLLHMSELSKIESQKTCKDENTSSSSGSIQVNTTSFNIVLKAWSNSGGGIHAAQRAESVLRMMMKLHGQGHENVKPNVQSFSTVIHAYSKVKLEEAASHAVVGKVMDLLDILEGSFIPTSEASNINSCYNAAAKVIVRNAGGKDAALHVEGLMNRMKNLDATPDINLLTTLCIAHVSAGSEESFQRGKNLLVTTMIDPKSDVYFEPNSISFNIILDYVLKSDLADKLRYAEELMAAMEGVGGNARPDVASYNMIISALCRSTCCAHCEEKAVDYMRKMLKSYRDGYEKAKPDSFVFNCIIGMLARSKHDWADNVIYRTLKAMENQQMRGNASVVPDTITYNMVIGKLAKKKTIDNAKKVMALLRYMEDSSLSSGAVSPDILTYTNVLQLQSSLNPQIAADIASSYLERTMKSHEKVQIDQLGFRTLLLALSRSYKFEHAAMTQKAWEWMENSDRAKCTVLYPSICNLVTIAYSKFDDSKAADRANSFLLERIDRWNKGDKTVIFPTEVGLGAALMSLGKLKRIDDALRLLDHIRALSKEGVVDLKLDEGCYANILNPLAQSQESNISADQVLRIVKRMKDDLESVTTVLLNSAISICSKTIGSQNDKRKAIEAAFLLFQLGRESASCDADTYGLMIRACINLTEDENTRMKLVKPLFTLCTKSGMVGCMVEREVETLKKNNTLKDHIAVEWLINLHQEKR